MELTADRLIVVGRGRLIAEGTVDDLVRQAASSHVRVDAADPGRLQHLLKDAGGNVSVDPHGSLVVTGMEARDVGIVAGTAGITLYELSPRSASLEQAFMELTRDAVEYTTRGAAA